MDALTRCGTADVSDFGVATTARPYDPVTVLLIEDDPGDALLVEEMAHDAMMAVDLVWTKSLEQARAHLRTATPDCILLDLHLPDAQGLDALASVQASAGDAPIVVMTGLAEDRAGLSAVAAGAQDYLVKGRVDADLFNRSVRYAIERKRAEAHAAALRASEQRSQENARLERGLLPVPLLRGDCVDVVARYRPGREYGVLGGDFYDVVETEDGSVHLLIGDICGHGPDEAALGVSLRIAWRTTVLGGLQVEDAMRTLEEVLVAERPQPHTFATVTTVVLPPDRTSMRVLRAGHPGLLLRNPDGVRWLEVPGGPALGLRRTRGRWTAHEEKIDDRTAIVLFTDGLFEGPIGAGERLGEERLLEFAQRCTATDADDFVDAVIAHAENLSADHGGLTDDIAVVHVEWARNGARQ